MPIKKKLTLSLSLLILASSALANTYKIKSGDTIEVIAKRVHVSQKAIMHANGLKPNSVLTIGRVLQIPGSVASKDAKSKKSVPAKVAKAAPATSPLKIATFKKVASKYAVVVGDSVTIRRGPGRDKTAVAKAGAGTRVTVLDKNGEWYKAKFPQGTVGWVRSDFLRAAPAPSTRVAKASPKKSTSGHFSQSMVAMQQKSGTLDKVLSRARSMRGVRYVYGAASRSATDCSGFTSQAFRSAGITIPRTSSAQAGVGVPVAKKDLKAGDLVFFHTVRGRRIGHVGIYTGKGKFIHASSGGGRVMESSMNEGYYKARYVTARRIVKAKAQAIVQNVRTPSFDASMDPATDPAATDFGR